MNSIAEIAALITGTERLLLTTHIRPDGDAIGSLTGLGRSLLACGTDVHLVTVDPLPDRFTYMAQGLVLEGPDRLSPPYDLVMALDCGDFERTGMVESLKGLGRGIINLDHHASNPGFGRWNHVDTEASSTCEIVLDLIQTAGWPLSKEVALSLYSGLCTDTRFFQIPAVRPSTLRAAADLLETGLELERVIAALKDNKAVLDLKVLALGLSEARTELEDRLIWTYLSQARLQELGATSRHAWSAGLFGSLNSLGSARAAVCFVEAEDGTLFCEYRSKRGFDVQVIASSFGGGGHRQASGCRLDSPERYPEVLAALREAIRSEDPSLPSG